MSISINSSGDITSGEFTIDNNKSFRISVVVPCFGRPIRTRRMIINILSQNINNWEAFVIGDGCPHFDEMIESGEVDYYKNIAEQNGNKLHCFNLKQQMGGYGYAIMNFSIKHARGKYIVFAANDDTIKRNHFKHYLSEIENTTHNMVYYNSYLSAHDRIRYSQLANGLIGHSECIFLTEKCRDFIHGDVYGHDWLFISQFDEKHGDVIKAASTEYTYDVRHIPGSSVDNID